MSLSDEVFKKLSDLFGSNESWGARESEVREVLRETLDKANLEFHPFKNGEVLTAEDLNAAIGKLYTFLQSACAHVQTNDKPEEDVANRRPRAAKN